MTPGDFDLLLSAQGQEALEAALAAPLDGPAALRLQERLRREYPPELARAAVEMADLRRRAVGKFSRAQAMYFTREALEQATSEAIACYRAGRFAPFNFIADLCCGIGGDLIGLADRVPRVLAVDRDPLRLAMARENLRAYGRGDGVDFRIGDCLAVDLAGVSAAFIDPDRRSTGQRTVRLGAYSPPLDLLLARLPRGFPLGVKAAPAVPRGDLAGLDAEREYISLDGELKECTLWFGPLRTVALRATLLPAGATLTVEQPAPPRPATQPGRYLYDPDPAVVCAGLVADLAERLDARPIDPTLAFLTADRFVPTPFARAYEVDEGLPFHGRRLGERLRRLGVGPVTIVKRGSAVDVDQLRRSWRLSGTEARTIILTRVLGDPFAFVARPVH